MKRWLYLSIAVSLCMPALADAHRDDVIVRPIVGCFHPSSQFVDVKYGPRVRGTQTDSLVVLAQYRTSGTEVYEMPFTFELRDQQWRVVPDDAHDTGPGSPSATCKWRSWQPIIER
jgi:hypothetical protein